MRLTFKAAAAAAQDRPATLRPERVVVFCRDSTCRCGQSLSAITRHVALRWRSIWRARRGPSRLKWPNDVLVQGRKLAVEF